MAAWYGYDPCSTASTSTGSVWKVWCTSTTSTTTTATYDVWQGWACDSTATTADSWVCWNSNDRPARRHSYRVPAVEDAYKLPAALHDAHVNAYRNHLWRVEEERRKAAERRAEDLLLQLLDAKQRKDFKEKDYFVVHGRNRRYRLRRGRTANIDVVCPKGKVEHRLCIHPRDDVPDCDTLVAQKLMIEADEDLVLRVANQHHPHETGRVLPALQ